MPGASKRLAHVAVGREPPSMGLDWFRMMENALDQLGVPRVVHPKNGFLRNVARGLSKLRLVRPILRLSRRAYFIPIMQPMEYRFFPVSAYAQVIPFCFDCWPPRWDEWEAMFRRHRVRIAFFTARMAGEEFARRIPQMECIWMPEATDPAYFKPEKPLHERSIDVLELGRKYDKYHDLITAPLASAGKVHLYEKIAGQMIFNANHVPASGMGDSKISLCFPSSLTHPARSGAVETVTMRYYESMASRCLIVGRAPKELIDDFGYNPVIEADMNRPAEQLLDLLEHIREYQSLADKNYQTTLERATWEARFKRVLELLGQRGYGPETA